MQAVIELKASDVRAAIDKVGVDIPGMTKEQVAERVIGLMTGELRLMDCQGLTEEAMEGVYALAYNTFRAGKYENAQKLFVFLTVYDHFNAKYWKGLGACRYNLGNYQGALQAYGMAQVSNPTDPRPQLRGAECCLAMNQRDNAVAALQAYLEMAQGNPKETDNLKRASALLKVLTKAQAGATAAQ